MKEKSLSPWAIVGAMVCSRVVGAGAGSDEVRLGRGKRDGGGEKEVVKEDKVREKENREETSIRRKVSTFPKSSFLLLGSHGGREREKERESIRAPERKCM